MINPVLNDSHKVFFIGDEFLYGLEVLLRSVA